MKFRFLVSSVQTPVLRRNVVNAAFSAVKAIVFSIALWSPLLVKMAKAKKAMKAMKATQAIPTYKKSTDAKNWTTQGGNSRTASREMRAVSLVKMVFKLAQDEEKKRS